MNNDLFIVLARQIKSQWFVILLSDSKMSLIGPNNLYPIFYTEGLKTHISVN